MIRFLLDAEDLATAAVLGEIEHERARQRMKFGNDRDDGRPEGELAEMGAFLVAPDIRAGQRAIPLDALELAYELRGDRRRELVVGIALAVAELERLDRAVARERAIAGGPS
jgi:hypothetical protein